MATALDYLKFPEFADNNLTESINIPPYQTGRPAQLGVFTDTPIATTYVRLGVSEEELTVIPARERGGETNKNMRGDIGGVSFNIAHFPLDDKIGPSDIQNITAFGEDGILTSLEDVYNDRLASMRAKHDLTHSYLDWGALNGLVIDGENKVLLNVYDKFGLAENVVEFDLETAATEISPLNRQVKAVIRKELRGTPSTGVRVLAGAAFFDMYVKHPNVLAELRAYREAGGQNPARDEIEDTFTFAGLTLERVDEQYRVRQANGEIVAREAVKTNEAIVLPLGTPYFKRYIAPPDTLSGANRRPTAETKVFVSTDDLPHDKGREIHTESNVLPICIRPQLMVRLKLKP